MSHFQGHLQRLHIGDRNAHLLDPFDSYEDIMIAWIPDCQEGRNSSQGRIT